MSKLLYFLIFLLFFTYQQIIDTHNISNKSNNNYTITNIEFYSNESTDNLDKKIKRHGILRTIPNAKANILICHGFMCSKYDVGFIREFLFPSYNVLSFDFRAHGENIDDQICTFGRNESLDVKAAVDFLKTNKTTRNLPIVAYSFSMGAVASIIAQAKEPNLFTGMILDCPYESTDKLLERGFNNLKFSIFGYQISLPIGSILKACAYNPYVQSFIKMLLKTVSNMDSTQINTHICQISPETEIVNVNIPCYFIACKNDDKAPENAVISVYSGAKGFKRLWITNGRRHFDSIFFNPEQYKSNINNFIESLLNKRYLKLPNEMIIKDPDLNNEFNKKPEIPPINITVNPTTNPILNQAANQTINKNNDIKLLA